MTSSGGRCLWRVWAFGGRGATVEAMRATLFVTLKVRRRRRRRRRRDSFWRGYKKKRGTHQYVCQMQAFVMGAFYALSPLYVVAEMNCCARVREGGMLVMTHAVYGSSVLGPERPSAQG